MKKVCAPLFAAFLVLLVGLVAFADTIRLKDGSVIKGQVIGFKDQQFIVLLGTGAGGRRSRLTIYVENVESIEFDSSPANASSEPTSTINSQEESSKTPTIEPPRTSQQDNNRQDENPRPKQDSGNSTDQGSQSRSTPQFFTINSHVRGDNTSNGWTNTGLVVRKGQKVRLTASGRVGIGNGRFSTPAGLPAVPDSEKLMRTEATGALIAVIGDDNDEFILIGAHREFTATRDGVLFLGVNEGNLKDNTGAYDVVIEAEAQGGK